MDALRTGRSLTAATEAVGDPILESLTEAHKSLLGASQKAKVLGWIYLRNL